MNETTLTIRGNLTADPELRYTQAGVAVANLTIASTPRVWDKSASDYVDGDTLFMRCSVWREMAENATSSLHKGTSVIATGRLKQRSYEDNDGNKRTVVEMEIEDIGPSIRFASAQVTRNSGGSKTQRSNQQQDQAWATPQTEEPWAASPTADYNDEVPF
jgi:single-strand DNA-binding protein